MRDIVKQFKIPYYCVPWLVLRLKSKMREGMRNVAPVEGMPDVITKLREQQYVLGIVSSNCEKIVRDFLDRHNIGVGREKKFVGMVFCLMP